jgi:hypothetical protein
MKKLALVDGEIRGLRMEQAEWRLDSIDNRPPGKASDMMG